MDRYSIYKGEEVEEKKHVLELLAPIVEVACSLAVPTTSRVFLLNPNKPLHEELNASFTAAEPPSIR